MSFDCCLSWFFFGFCVYQIKIFRKWKDSTLQRDQKTDQVIQDTPRDFLRRREEETLIDFRMPPTRKLCPMEDGGTKQTLIEEIISLDFRVPTING